MVIHGIDVDRQGPRSLFAKGEHRLSPAIIDDHAGMREQTREVMSDPGVMVVDN